MVDKGDGARPAPDYSVEGMVPPKVKGDYSTEENLRKNFADSSETLKVRTLEGSYLTLESLLREINSPFDDENINLEYLVNNGILPFYVNGSGKKGKKLIVALGSSIEGINTDKVKISNALEQSGLKLDQEYIILRGEHFSKLSSLVNSPSERSKFLGDITVENSAQETFLAALTYGVAIGASDIHLKPGRSGGSLFYRVDGIMEYHSNLGEDLFKKLIAVVKTESELDISEKRMPQDGRISNLDERSSLLKDYSFRVSVMPQTLGPKAVLRVLKTANLDFSLEDIGFEDRQLKRFKEQVDSRYGFIVIGGPTGSGKTTTLYSALNHLSEQPINIVTVEDPVEMGFDKLNQIQVDEKIGRTFPVILRGVLRQDPDSILIGEIRDEETARIAIDAADTGHLVLSTIHSKSAVEILKRFYSFGIDNSVLASNISLFSSQRLLRRLSHNNLSEYDGRIAIFEGWVPSEEERSIINSTQKNMVDYNLLLNLALKGGMDPMVVDGAYKIKKGLTNIRELKRIIPKSEFLKHRKRLEEILNERPTHNEDLEAAAHVKT